MTSGNDEVIIDSNPKTKLATLIPHDGAPDIDLAGYLAAGAVWPMLRPGVNEITWGLHLPWFNWISASYIPKYWGV